MVRLVVAVIVWIALAAIAGNAHAAENRVALVIGNGAYRHLPRLDNPASDARLMATTLKELGFTLIGGSEQTNLDRPGFERAIRVFGAALSRGSVGLLYYAGHGVQIQGVNYLVPVDANPASAADVDFELIDAGLALRQMEAAGSRLNFVILDACRNNPLAAAGLRSAGGGLAEMKAPAGTLISYATQPGNVAYDGASGHSPYTLALAAAMRQPGLGVFEVFNTAAVTVKNATGGKQQPWVSSSPIEGNFNFLGPSNAMPQLPPSAAADPELVFWQSISASNNPADFEEYLRKYPNGQFAGLARNRLAQSRPAAGPAPTGSPDVTIEGAWSGTVSGNGFQYPVEVALQQKGEEISGRMTENQAGRIIETILFGSISRTEVGFTKKYPSTAGFLANHIFKYKLSITNDHIALGSWSGEYPPPNDVGKFEMTRR